MNGESGLAEVSLLTLYHLFLEWSSSQGVVFTWSENSGGRKMTTFRRNS